VRKLSFSYNLKTELGQYTAKKMCCLKAECYGAWLFSKSFSLKKNDYVSENGAAVRKMAELAAIVCDVTAEVQFAMSRRKKTAYRLSLPDMYQRKILLETFGHTGSETNLRINKANLQGECCTAAFLRGAFLSCGTMTDPTKEYHLEFSSQFQKLSEDLAEMISETELMQVQPLMANRKGSFLIYLKDSGQIEEILTYMGASNSAMELMQICMYKDMRNDINRKMNFETANMDRTYSASAKQIAAIAKIQDAGKMDKLTQEQREVAELRLFNQEMTLRELAEALRLSRSSVNYRMKQILAFAEKLPAVLD
jgi:conserved hypothetical protein